MTDAVREAARERIAAFLFEAHHAYMVKRWHAAPCKFAEIRAVDHRERWFAVADAVLANPAALALDRQGAGPCKCETCHDHGMHLTARPAFCSCDAGTKARIAWNGPITWDAGAAP